MTTTDEAATGAPAVITASHRSSILGYASELLPLRGRVPEAVLAAAAPLLDWAGQAAGKDGLQARMAAMSRAHLNGVLRPQGPRDFLDDAALYLAFITGTSA
jgi:hypothetical protein